MGSAPSSQTNDNMVSAFTSKSKIHTHYANMSMQYTAIFHGCKIDNFQMKILIFFLFLLKT